MILLAGLALGGAWVPDPGATYLKLEGSGFEGAQHDLGVAVYGEAGVLPGLGLEARLPWTAAWRDGPGYAYRWSGVGDVQAGARARLPWGTGAVTAGVKVPAYRPVDEARWGALADRFPRPGDGQVDVDLRLDAGRSVALGGGWGWAQAGLGWRFRAGEPADGALGRAQVGWSLPAGGARPELRWVAFDADGVLALDRATRQGLGLGLVTAVGLAPGLDLELRAAGIPVGTDPGYGGALALAWTREGHRRP